MQMSAVVARKAKLSFGVLDQDRIQELAINDFLQVLRFVGNSENKQTECVRPKVFLNS
ncbi:Hypothetical protein FKW44_016847 [Caligus rogercresseyi]|uniref:Uncharacterized protein n=1 Tax=Caligus rogercresseyi TaxID=217165 RepID=A0A7T8H2D5_CALRO|nr:Hypothetical protein FKW44_016847 [Caligus rogercresseyi]